MKLKRLRVLSAAVVVLFTGMCFQSARAATTLWPTIGPDGGDARRFAVDPQDPSRIYLGTTDSWIYVSNNGGTSWRRLSRVAPESGLVVDSLEVDRSNPQTLFAGVWIMAHPGGGIYISHDGGRTWTASADMKGQSILSLAQSRTRPQELIAGTLQGVYRSEDRGVHWREISPPGSTEIHEVESVAIDPYDPGIIYAGTWHLPWKTMDGGKHWVSMSKGLIVDSDIFSIIVDPDKPQVVYLSACSGIYRSDDFGDNYRKVQGIPTTARRTRAIRMDPKDHSVVYAGTTEGLWKTVNGGQSWTLNTGRNVIVNDVYIDPRNPQHILLATDRSGVLASNDGGKTFHFSNTGFSQRQVAALLTDKKTPGTMYAGVLNDKTFGGVFLSTNYGHTWTQRSEGLHGLDVFKLGQGPSGTLLAGTSNGIFRWTGSEWKPSDLIAADEAAMRDGRPVPRGARAVERRVDWRRGPSRLEGRVTGLAESDGTWYAATYQGVFRSTNDGISWEGPVLGGEQYPSFYGTNGTVAMATHGATVYVARRDGLVVSHDRGKTWEPVVYPSGLTAIYSLAVTPQGTLWVGGREGVFVTSDQGAHWKKLSRLPVVAVNSLTWDGDMGRMLLTSSESTVVFAIDPANMTWKWWNPGWPLQQVTSAGGRLIAVSDFSGLAVQPETETASASEMSRSEN
jgi:photosystem II stability/assembly factor-like uncharacterized protein